MKYISKFILKAMGWHFYINTPDLPKYVICVAPHTSNWDFVIGKLFYWSFGRNDARFIIKKEWFKFPLNLIMGPLGGIPVDRSVKTSLVDQVVKMFNENDNFKVAITPEGTRKKNPNWKRGFYQIAAKAKVPIVLAYFDYEKKTGGFEKVFYPTGDEKADMREIMLFYKDKKGRHPEQFSIGNIE